ncbi:YdcF family protein [Kocuria massiliensis]|uniref:YdcF family protein n=1 Tax=Kocuria massiliensis TaxID=1926282 RepID=UPI000A1CF077|nr:YdcF family protein [Kocuria massiliensis]
MYSPHTATHLFYIALGLGMLGYCVAGFRRAGHRLRYGACSIVGVLMILNSALSLLSQTNLDWLTFIMGLVVLLAMFALMVGYVSLIVFLLINGATIIRKEGRRPKNLLALGAGLWMIALPFGVIVIFILAASGATWVAVVAGMVYALLWYATGYIAFCFLSFLISTLAYRRLSARFHPKYVIILGAGLMGTKVTPLLASRLDRAVMVFRREQAAGRTPMLIPSGGQGPDEVVPESHAMREYLLEQGIPDEFIRVEDQSTTTLENLRFSQRLMDDPKAPVYVATSDYHVYRAAIFMNRVGLKGRGVGAKTARYYVPSAFLREFAAIMVANRWIHLIALTPIALGTLAIVVLAVMAQVN